ncbi:MAG: CheR family methyltransferase, partial [Thermoanaerobaculia bacterium]
MSRGAAVQVSRGALERLVGLIREETGNVVPRARYGFLEEIAARRARSHGFARASDYAAALAAGRLGGEWEQLIPLVTVKESFFFRAPQQFAAMERHVLPVLVRSRQTDRTLRIWCGAAARGEEPATLALILAEHEALASWEWRIVATDLDGEALAAAERGLYGERAVGQVPDRIRDRWFTRRGSLYELHPGIRGRIEYRPLNLARPPYRDLGVGPPFDLVLLRNVLIYFARPLQRRVLGEVTRRLAPDGYLFLGASETLWQIFDRLAPVELESCFAYRHPDRVPSRPDRPRPPSARKASRPARPAPLRPERPERPAAEEPRPAR